MKQRKDKREQRRGGVIEMKKTKLDKALDLLERVIECDRAIKKRLAKQRKIINKKIKDADRKLSSEWKGKR